MKHIFFFISLFLGLTIAQAQDVLYITGSAVPDGKTIELEKWDDGTFKYHGTLLPGELYIQTTNETTANTRCIRPKRKDCNIVGNAQPYMSYNKTPESAWVVLFEADNYRFTVNTKEQTVTGEIFTWWYECWIVGGCTSEGQSEAAGGWDMKYGKQMVQSATDPYEWTWVGLLKNYVGNVESKRFKIVGQYDWTPKHLHPYVQDASILTAKQVIYNNSNDYKWQINEDGYYRITCNVFRETISGEYLGKTLPDGLSAVLDVDTRIKVANRTVEVKSDESVAVRLVGMNGSLCGQKNGNNVEFEVPSTGVYMVRVEGEHTHLTRKIFVQ